MSKVITEGRLEEFAARLRSPRRSTGTIANYIRHVRAFADYLGGAEATRAAALGWRGELIERGYGPATVNGMLVALNRFFIYHGWCDCRVALLRVQRRVFRDEGRELTREEYERLVETALGTGRDRLALVIETICATGIRVSELRYITVEAARCGQLFFGPSLHRVERKGQKSYKRGRYGEYVYQHEAAAALLLFQSSCGVVRGVSFCAVFQGLSSRL